MLKCIMGKTNPLIQIAMEYDIFVEFDAQIEDCTAYCRFDQIEIGTKDKSTAEILSSFFHELAHIVNYRNNHFKTIHHFNPDDYTQREIKIILKTGLAAEQYTDLVGKILMKEYYPSIEFIYL